MGFLERVANNIKRITNPKKALVETTDTLRYDTSLVYIPEYESLSDVQKKQADKYAKDTKMQNITDVIMYDKDMREYFKGIIELLTSMLYKSTDEIKNKNIDRMSEEERSTMRVDARLVKEQVKYYRQVLDKKEEEVILRAVALKKIYEEHKKSGRVFGRIFLHPVQEIAQRRFEHERFNKSLERMKILKKTIEQQQMGITNAINNLDILEQAIILLEKIKGENEEQNTRKVLDKEEELLLRQAQLVRVEESFAKIAESILAVPKETDEHEETRISRLARIKVILAIYAYKNKDQINTLRKKVEDLRGVEKTDKNKEELLHKIEDLETRYKVFGRYINEEDWDSLYRAKFDILVSDLNKCENCPIDIYKLKEADAKELKIYRNYINEKLDKILRGQNKEIERAFLDGQVSDEMNRAKKLGEVTELIKRIIKNPLYSRSGLDMTDNILENRDLLSLILAFDKPRGIEKMTLRKTNDLIRRYFSI